MTEWNSAISQPAVRNAQPPTADLSRALVRRLVRDIMAEQGHADLRLSTDAVEALQAACTAFLVELFTVGKEMNTFRTEHTASRDPNLAVADLRMAAYVINRELFGEARAPRSKRRRTPSPFF